MNEINTPTIRGEHKTFIFGMQRSVNRLMVEGGATLNWSLLSQELVDENYTYVGNIIIGGEDAPTPVDGSGFISEDAMTKLELLSTEMMDEGVLLRWRIRKE